MKKLVIAAMGAASILAIASPAAAQSTTGTITLNGSVAPKCLVVPGSGTTWGTTINLGELADATGKLRASSTIESQINGATGTTARIVCTSGAPTISVDSTAITTAAASAAGYDNSIDFTASVAVTTTTPANNGPFVNDSANAALAATAIGGGRIANNGGDNVVVTTSNFRTDNAADLLVADPSYTGSIVVVIAPN
jgi:hypothetical protein